MKPLVSVAMGGSLGDPTRGPACISGGGGATWTSARRCRPGGSVRSISPISGSTESHLVCIQYSKADDAQQINKRKKVIPTCMNAIPTRTPATSTRFFSSHSSPAWTQPFSLIMLDTSPGWKSGEMKKNACRNQTDQTKGEYVRVIKNNYRST